MSGETVMLPGDPAVMLRHLPGDGPPVLFVHGATFPSALAAGYRFNGRSWMDDVHAAGYDAWALDFAGYGGSERYAAMQGPCEGLPVGRAPEAAEQIARAVSHILRCTDRKPSLIAHSWGTIAAGLYAAQNPQRLDKLCLFGPIAQRDGGHPTGTLGPWRLVSLADQLARFAEDVPAGHPPVLIEPALEQWGPAYLATDPFSHSRTAPAVMVPSGPVADIGQAWSGRLGYRPQDIRVPTLTVRGAWDSVTTDADADWLLSRIAHPLRRDVRVPKGTHLMHLEHSREGLFAAVRDFLGEST